MMIFLQTGNLSAFHYIHRGKMKFSDNNNCFYDNHYHGSNNENKKKFFFVDKISFLCYIINGGFK